MQKRKLLSIFLALVICIAVFPTVNITAATTLTSNSTGTEDGYDYELWKDSGNTSMTLTGGGTFSCEWSNINNALFRKGKKFDCTKTYQEIGNISIDFSADYNPSGNSYLCVYGWTRDPLVEYYIVECWGSWRPPGATSMGTVTIDGGTYDIYETIRENQPSIDGNTTFKQYWSVRTEKRTSGTISVSKHFAAWESMGMPMGKLYETALNVEGYQSSGSANVTKNNITVGGEIEEVPTTEPTTVEPNEDGYYFHSTYESNTDSWSERGDSSIAVTNNAANVGNKSLYVSGRTDSWNGTGYSLSTSTFQPGKAYSFSAMVMQNSSSSEDFMLSLQYDVDGETNYTTVAKATAEKGVWTQLANTSFTIPTGATNMLLYVETPENLIDFYLDEAIGAPKGTIISSSSSYKLGDVNHSDTIDKDDLKDLSSFILGKSVTIYDDTSDINENDVIDSLDMSALREIIVNNSVVVEQPTTEVTLDPNQWNNTADISWIDTSKPMVALSFDDGPVGTSSSASSIRIQDAISDNGGHATFFYWGNRITSSNEAEITRAESLGFEVANHTYSHPYLTNLSATGIKEEISKTSEILTRLTGRTNFLIRPPYLSVNSTVQENCGAPLITCAIDSSDWNQATSQQIIDTVITNMNNGTLDNSVVLMHETYDSTAEAIEYLAPYLKQQGWQIVTVSEMFKANGKNMYNGTVYSKVS